MNCKRGGFIIIRHKNVQDFEANLLKTNLNKNGLTGDDARPGIRAHEAWRRVQNPFFNIRLTNANVRSQKHLPVSTTLKKKHEKEKKRAYNGRIMNLEHGFFFNRWRRS